MSNAPEFPRPILVRQLTGFKWDYALFDYDESMNLKELDDDNYYDENNIFFYCVQRLQPLSCDFITSHYLIKIDKQYYEIVFTNKENQNFPKLKKVNFEEYDSFSEKTIIENDGIIFYEKKIVKSLTNQNVSYFIIKYMYKSNEKQQSCNISFNYGN